MKEAENYAKQQAELIRKQQQYQLEQQKIAEQQRLNALEQNKQQLLNQAMQQKKDINEQAKTSQQQAYLQKMKQQKELNEQLVRAGLGNSGVRETTLSELYGNYGSNINSINAQKLKSLQEIANKESDIESEYGQNYSTILSEEALKKAQIQAGIDELALNQYNQAYSNYVAQKQYEDALKQQEYENQLAQKKYEDALKQQQWENQMAERQYQDTLKQQSYKNSLSSPSTSNYNFSDDNIERPTNNKNQTDAFGNNIDTQNKANYYFKNSTQPRYINNNELLRSGKKVGDLFESIDGVDPGQSIWTTAGRYYIWNNKTKTYHDITAQYKQLVSTSNNSNNMSNTSVSNTKKNTSTYNNPFSLIANTFTTLFNPTKR